MSSSCIIYVYFCFEANFCKKKFRTLRERYTRELRKSYLEPANAVKYEYFKELSFLSPYIKFRSISFESADGKTVVTKREDVTMEKEDRTSMDQDTYFAEEQEQEPTEHFIQETSGTQNIIYETVPELQIHEVVQQSDEENLIMAKKPHERKRKPSWNDIDVPDDVKYFAMSVACSLKKLSTGNSFKAKVEIYQVLEKFSSKQELEKK